MMQMDTLRGRAGQNALSPVALEVRPVVGPVIGHTIPATKQVFSRESAERSRVTLKVCRSCVVLIAVLTSRLSNTYV